MIMKRPDDDVVIIDGEGFFPPHKPYQHHVQSAKYSKPVRSSDIPELCISTDVIHRNLKGVSISRPPGRLITKAKTLTSKVLQNVHVIMGVYIPPALLTCMLEKGGLFSVQIIQSIITSLSSEGKCTPITPFARQQNMEQRRKRNPCQLFLPMIPIAAGSSTSGKEFTKITLLHWTRELK
jgi:hypothetical protein